jgi:hypothetical protein
MRALLQVLLVLAIVVFLEAILSVPRLFNDGLPWVLSRDIPIMMALLVCVSSWRSQRFWLWVFGLGWALVLFYEITHAAGLTAMSQEPLLYDVFFLMGHLLVLCTDLMGAKALFMFGAVGLGLALLFGLGVLCFGGCLAMTRRWSGGRRGWAIALLGLGVFVAQSRPDVAVRDTMGNLVANIGRSANVVAGIQKGVDPSAYEDIGSTVLKAKPRVHIYIIESYGAGILADPIQEQYFQLRKTMAARLSEHGWGVVTGRSEAPVMGGRSWLADASLLSGRLIKFESVYRHLVDEFGRLRTLVSFFKRNGYATVLMRQNNKARPGVDLVNHFGFSDTVFFDDIAYTGRPYGWAEVPDQYALGHLRDAVLPGLSDTPEFVFAHLGSSHIPWHDLPPVVKDYRELVGRVVQQRSARTALSAAQIKAQMKRFKRSDSVRLRRLRASDANYASYFRAISYSFESVVGHIEKMSDPPDLIVVMGDHQPPLYRKSTNFTVPVHVFARDKALLGEFKTRGFRGGMRLGKKALALKHEAFFSVMVRSLAGAEGAAMPQFRADGVGMGAGPSR